MNLVRPNFLNLDEELSDPERSGVLVLPLPLDITASWKRGTGPTGEVAVHGPGAALIGVATVSGGRLCAARLLATGEG